LNVVSGTTLANSFLPVAQQRWDEIRYATGAVSKRIVPVLALDDYAARQGLGEIHLIKARVQGYELEVLRGAANLLRRTRYVLVTSAMRPMYEGAPRFTDVFVHLDAHGFHLVGFQAWHRGNQTLIEGDLLFRRNDLMPPVDDRIDRVYSTLST
jgi:hypothetical protein